MIYINIVVLESSMLHASFVEIGPPGPENENKILKGFNHIWAWQPSWSCDLDNVYTNWVSLPTDVSNKIWL